MMVPKGIRENAVRVRLVNGRWWAQDVEKHHPRKRFSREYLYDADDDAARVGALYAKTNKMGWDGAKEALAVYAGNLTWVVFPYWGGEV